MNKCTISIEIDLNNLDASHDTEIDYVAELLLRKLNNEARWGYSTYSFSKNLIVSKLLLPPKVLMDEYSYVTEDDSAHYWHIENINMYVGIHWDGDGMLTMYLPENSLLLSNSDCKCSYGWKAEYCTRQISKN